jgi:hypothetical protein
MRHSCGSPQPFQTNARIVSSLSLNYFTTGSFNIFSNLLFSSVQFIEKNEMGWACGTYGGKERGAQGVGGETRGKETIGETKT